MTVTYDVKGRVCSPCEWRPKYQGRPTAENLARDVATFEASCLPGGCNAHLGPMTVLSAKITDHRKNLILAVWSRLS